MSKILASLAICLLMILSDITNSQAIDVCVLAKQYNTFQHQVGQGNVEFEKVVPVLFSESFTKTANGVQLVSQRNGLKDQLLGIRKMAGKWSIDVKEISAFQDSQRCLIRYFLISEKAGKFDVMATLRMNKDGLIEEIDEVYYQPASDNK